MSHNEFFNGAQIIRYAANVPQELFDGDMRALSILRYVLAEWITQGESSSLFELQDGCRRELLGNGADFELRIGRYSHLPLDVGHAVTLIHDELAAIDNAEGYAWRS